MNLGPSNTRPAPKYGAISTDHDHAASRARRCRRAIVAVRAPPSHASLRSLVVADNMPPVGSPPASG